MYLLDTNVFIQAKNLHYGFDFCPAFWQWLEQKNQQGKVFSIQKVKDEINNGEDKLSAWINNLSSDFFKVLTSQAVEKFDNINGWIDNQNYDQTAINQFQSVADYYLIASAIEHNATIVTHEKPNNSTKKIQIPNACIGLQINWMDPFALLRKEQAKFVLP